MTSQEHKLESKQNTAVDYTIGGVTQTSLDKNKEIIKQSIGVLDQVPFETSSWWKAFCK